MLIRSNDRDNKFSIKMLEFFDVGNSVCIVFEKMSRDLSHVVKNGKLSADDVKIICKKVLTAVAELHRAGISHRDVKPENILINDQGQNNVSSMIIKLADLGFARFGHRLGYSTAGTLYYRAPELVVGSKCCHFVDLWACGCVLFEVATSNLLFPVPSGDNGRDEDFALSKE